MYQHILVPVDGTDLSIDLVGHALGLARSLGARLSFFHVLPDQQAHLRNDLEILRLSAPEAYALAAGGRARELLAKCGAAARALGVPCSTAYEVSDRPAEAIVAKAHAAACDLILMASHGSRTRLGMALGSQTLAVLMQAGLPVLVASTGKLAAPARAIAVIRDEHRSLAAVLHAWLEALAAMRDGSRDCQTASMSAALNYLGAFSDQYHHPKESNHLFRLLRNRTNALNAELDELDRQHERDSELVQQLRADLVRLAGADPVRRVAELLTLEQHLGHYAEFVWDHLGREEGVVLPAAQHYLREADWRELDAHFSSEREQDGFSAAVAAQDVLRQLGS